MPVADDIEQRLIERPETDAERTALRALVRLRGEGKTLEEIAAGVKEASGIELSAEAVDRLLRRVAGPVVPESGGDPAYFTGYLGGG
jgi:hypothetical protein